MFGKKKKNREKAINTEVSTEETSSIDIKEEIQSEVLNIETNLKKETDNQEENDYTGENDDSSKVIYVVSDRELPGLINYFRCCGVNVSNVYTNIIEARNTILMQSEPCRIVIADTGTGRFTSTKVRQELIDMLGICDENNKVTVFYTDSVIKTDTISELANGTADIDWYIYNGTVAMVATLLKYGEHYVLSDFADDDDKPIELKDLGNICGKKNESVSEDKQTEIVSSLESILNGFNNGDNELPRYTIEL